MGAECEQEGFCCGLCVSEQLGPESNNGGCPVQGRKWKRTRTPGPAAPVGWVTQGSSAHQFLATLQASWDLGTAQLRDFFFFFFFS